jgi:D-serine dehydratase
MSLVASLEVSSLDDAKEVVDTTIRAAIDPLHKGIGHLAGPAAPHNVVSLDWNLLREDVNLPAAVLYQDRISHNLKWMQQFIAEYGLKLAPHGKTTMAPKLFDMQLQAGAWGITLATAHQTSVAYQHGVRRVLMANQLVGRENMAVIARLQQDTSFEYYCLVDSATQVDQLGTFFLEAGQELKVLIELGVTGGRAGIRDEPQLQSVLHALRRRSASLTLCGIEMYEGVLDNEEAIRTFLQRAVGVTQKLLQTGRFQRSPALLTGAGSAWYDVVAEVFSVAGFGESVEVILRPGCYLTHDIGVYRDAQEKIQLRNPIAHKMRSGLLPALQVWAYVQSIPEPEKAIIALGKRDAAFDAGLPIPALHFRSHGATPNVAPTHWHLTKMMDQHAYLQITAGDDIRVGDMIGFDISHPCLTFDKWRSLLVIDSQYQVVDVIQTFF